MASPTDSRRKTTGRKVCEAIHALAAGLWLGALVMAAVTAGVLFTTMRTLEPSFARFDAYSGDQSNIGAGFIQNRVFLAADTAQFVGVMLTLGSTAAMIAFFGLPLRRVSSAVRLAALGISVLLASYHLLVLAPRMGQNAEAYWSAASAGDNAAAEAAHAAFIADHPTARSVLGTTALFVAVLLASGAWSAATPTRGAGPVPPTPRDGPEPPNLSRGIPVPSR